MRIIICIVIFCLSIFLAFPSIDHQPNTGVNPTVLRTIGLDPFVYPVMTPRLSSAYGMRKHPLLKFSRKHQGVDLAAEIGAPVRSVAPGRVVFADPYAGYGNFVVVEHLKGITTHYGHCDQIKVRPGQSVNAGDIIATIGNTGMSSGAHLHFELRINGIPQNPENYIPDLASHPEG